MRYRASAFDRGCGSRQVDLELTCHAALRQRCRGVSATAVSAVLEYGRSVHVRQALIYVIGRKEVEFYRKEGVNLDSFEGIHVVCNSTGAVILTVYRNRDFRRLRARLSRFGRFSAKRRPFRS